MSNTDKRKAALKEYQEKVKSGEIERTVRKNLKEKWEEDKTSLRKSINYMCVQCFGGEDWEGGDDVQGASKGCALWNVRPYK